MTHTKTNQTADALVQKVETLIKEVNLTHRYSMSRIYELYNEVFAAAEAPQSCASCLIRKVNQLKSWLTNQQKDEDIIKIKTKLKASNKRKKLNSTN